MRIRVVLSAATAVSAALALALPARALNPQTAGLQVALRAYGLYGGRIDAIAGPKTARAVRAFQRGVHLPVTGRADRKTRRALGPLGRPLFGTRTLRRGAFGWDVSVLQFLLARHGYRPGPIGGYFGAETARALRRYQRSLRLHPDAVAGPKTIAALAFQSRVPVRTRAAPANTTLSSPWAVRTMIDRWAGRYRVDRHLARALAWMESGYQTNLTSPSGAWGVMQVLPATWKFVEQVLLRRRVPRTADGNVRVGIVYLRHLLREFRGSERLALAAWYQGARGVRRHGLYPQTRRFVAAVLALKRRM